MRARAATLFKLPIFLTHFCVMRMLNPAKSSWTRFLPKFLTNLPKILTNLPKILPNLPKTCPRSCPRCQDYAGQFLAKILAKILPKIWHDLSLLARSCSSWQEPCPRTFCWVNASYYDSFSHRWIATDEWYKNPFDVVVLPLCLS